MRHIFLANFLGLQAHTVPVGGVDGGRDGDSVGLRLPVGLQLLGAPWSEHVLLRLAAALDEAEAEREPAHPRKRVAPPERFFCHDILQG